MEAVAQSSSTPEHQQNSNVLWSNLSMFFVDTIVENDTAQDMLSTLSIVEALLCRIRQQLPSSTHLTFISDNATTYQNDLLPVALVSIARDQEFTMQGFIHPDSQCSKNMVDAHFAVAKRHILRYIKETTKDVVTPKDIYDALVYDDGLRNTAVDYVVFERDSDALRDWTASWKSGLLKKMGRVGEFVYRTVMEHTQIDAYVYSGAEYVTYKVEGKETSRISTSHDHHNVVIEGMNDVPMADDVVTNEQQDEIDGEGVRLGSGTSLFINSDIDNPDIGRTQQQASPQPIRSVPNAESIFIGSQTGVQMKYMSSLHAWRRKVFIRDRTAFADVTAEIEVDDTECAHSDHAHPAEGSLTDETSFDVVEEDSSVDNNDNTGATAVSGNGINNSSKPKESFICSKCSKVHRWKQSLVRHSETCGGGKVDKGILNRSVVMGFSAVCSGGARETYDVMQKHPALRDVEVDMDNDAFELQAQWARRPKRGNTFGVNNVQLFQKDIREWFNAGNKGKGRKFSASMIFSALQNRYPGRYDIPSARQINALLCRLTSEYKKKLVSNTQDNNDDSPMDNSEVNTSRMLPSGDGKSTSTIVPNVGGASQAGDTCSPGATTETNSRSHPEHVHKSSRQRSSMPERYSLKIMEMLLDDPGLRPSTAYDKLLVAVGCTMDTVPSDFPSRSSIRNKVCNLKRKGKLSPNQPNTLS